MMSRTLAALRGLRRDRRGASILELGLVLPILMVVLLGLIDVASLFSARMSLQQAAARALERVQVGNSRTNFTFVETEAAAAAAAAGFPAATASSTTWLECNQVRQQASVQDCPAGQQRARYVDITITADYDPYFRYSPLGARQPNGNVRMRANSSVRYQ